MAVFSITSSLVVLFSGLYILHAHSSCSVALANYLPNANSNNSRVHAALDSNLIYFEGMGHEGQLLVKLRLGEWGQFAWVIFSTTDFFTSVMCRPCKTCGKSEAQLFNPASATYKTVPCSFDSCESIRRFPCEGEQDICTYEQPFVGDLTASGILSKETLYFHQGSTDEFIVENVLFGCTHQINGEKPKHEIVPAGYMGINDDNLSIINQLFYTKEISRRFSFCIPFGGQFSLIYFGNTPAVLAKITTTPLIIGQFNNLYYVHLKKIVLRLPRSVGTNPLQIAVEQEKDPHSRIDGNIFIDTATHVTFIDDNVMYILSEKILDYFPRNRVPVPENFRHLIDLCFDWSEPDVHVLPTISFHLSDNGVIRGSRIFVTLEEGVLCLLVASSKHSRGVQKFGSGVLGGNRFEIDLEKKVVNIKANDCPDSS